MGGRLRVVLPSGLVHVVTVVVDGVVRDVFACEDYLDAQAKAEWVKAKNPGVVVVAEVFKVRVTPEAREVRYVDADS